MPLFVTANGHSTEICELIALGNEIQLLPCSSKTLTDKRF